MRCRGVWRLLDNLLEVNRQMFDRKIYRRRWEEKRRSMAITKYGGKCHCCQESIQDFLVIDHIEGSGNKHRKELNSSGFKRGSDIYNWLYKNNYPNGFQVLCWNCNWGKFKKGLCPHQAVINS